MTLERAAAQKFYIIKKIKGGMRLHRRLLDMGLTTGTGLFLAARAPAGGAVLIALRGIFIALRDSAAREVEVEADCTNIGAGCGVDTVCPKGAADA